MTQHDRSYIQLTSPLYRDAEGAGEFLLKASYHEDFAFGFVEDRRNRAVVYFHDKQAGPSLVLAGTEHLFGMRKRVSESDCVGDSTFQRYLQQMCGQCQRLRAELDVAPVPTRSLHLVK